MRTSRLKNIVIVILLLVNVFLLVLLLSRRAEERPACFQPPQDKSPRRSGGF